MPGHKCNVKELHMIEGNEEEGRVKVYPVAILERKLIKKDNRAVVAGLIQ